LKKPYTNGGSKVGTIEIPFSRTAVGKGFMHSHISIVGTSFAESEYLWRAEFGIWMGEGVKVYI
jgi:hypothetical protein